MVQEGISGFAQLSCSLDDKVKATKDQDKVTKKILKASKEREIKLWVELTASQNAIQELEAWLAKKKEVIAKKRSYATKMEEWLGITKSKLLATEEWATSTAAQAIEEYRKSKDFLQKVIEGSVEVYQLVFANYNEKIAQVFL